jgi:hypothetical protein
MPASRGGFVATAVSGAHLCFLPVNGSPRPPVPDDPYPAWAPPPNAPAPAPAPRRSIGGFFTAYFAAGLALLVIGFVTAVVLVLRPAFDHRAAAPVTSSRSAHSRTAATTPGESASAGPNGAALGPQQLTMGRPLAVTGENGEKFEVTVIAGKYRKTGCNPYAVKPKKGGYLPTTVRVKVLDGVPDVSEFDFRFQRPDGEWLDSVGGSGCETTGVTGLFRRLTAGRTYVTTVVFDVPKQPLKGDIVFVWPLQDVIGSWKVG